MVSWLVGLFVKLKKKKKGDKDGERLAEMMEWGGIMYVCVCR